MANLKGTCAICDVSLDLARDSEESEIINCTECRNRLVIKRIVGEKATLEEAPEVEEDWGE